MFEGPVTGNIPEVLDNGEVTDGTHVTAGQLALALTPYAQVTDLAVNTAASGNNAAAIQSLDDRVTAELASKLDSSTLAPAIAPTRQTSRPSTCWRAWWPLRARRWRWTPRWPTLSWASPPRRWPPSSQAETPPSRGCRPPIRPAVGRGHFLAVDSKIATALGRCHRGSLDAAKADKRAGLPVSTVDGLTAPRRPRPTQRLLASNATNAALGQADRSRAPRRNPCGARRPAASGSGGVVNAPAWADLDLGACSRK